ncbi:MAG: M6 family metalloprotease domain-containing protein [Prevotella sp.]|nr:M6 family metalloprotease domain-containing protein [Prevotella sp.]
MKKQIISTFILSMTAIAMMAVPAKRGQWKNIQLTDGQSIRVVLTGDEHMHFFQDAEGNRYVKNADGLYEIANDETMAQRAQERRMKAQQRRAKRLAPRKAEQIGNFTGNKKGLIILAAFKDKAFESGHNNALYQKIANEEGYNEGEFVGSVADYFKAQSRGVFNLTFDVVGPVTLSKNASAYGGNDSYGDDKDAGAMIVEACKAADAQVNFKDYDWDGDGEVDQVFVLYAGAGEANGGDEDTVWPHEWDLTSATGQSITLDGVKIDTYACSPELQPDDYDYDYFGNLEVYSWKLDGLGTICHEFSHCLGYPDMYDTNYQNIGMASWDLMDQGSYNGDGFVPAGYTSYERMVAGWLEPIELKEAKEVTSMKALSEGGESYIMYNDAHKDEYYLLENRQKTGWDALIPGKGLLILHVDYDANLWYNNAVNTTSGKYNYGNNHQRLTTVAADNKYQYETFDGARYYTDEGMAGDPFPYQSNNSFSNTSKPAATLYNANTDGKKYLNKKVYDITQNSDKTIAFKFDLDGDGGSGNNPTPTPSGEYFFYETFDLCNGKGGNDGVWQGNIAQGAFTPDNDGWTSDAAYGANQCAKFGKSKGKGVATTPSFTVTGEGILTVKAAAWGDEECTLELTATGATLGESTITLPNKEWSNFTTTLTGNGPVTLTFTPSQMRFFLDEVSVAKPEETNGIQTINNEPLTTHHYYNLAGQRVTKTTKGIYIVNGKKILIK